jgi:hypothetical protein
MSLQLIDPTSKVVPMPVGNDSTLVEHQLKQIKEIARFVEIGVLIEDNSPERDDQTFTIPKRME